jgi:enoyl-CoA hydratase
MSFENLTIDRADHVATVWIDRPDKLNALHRPLWESIPSAIRMLDADEDVRAIVLTGRGRAFCAGIDLIDHAYAFANEGSISGRGDSPVTKRQALLEDVGRYQQTVNSLADVRKPVIASIHGACLGAGMDLITACDIRVAAADAIFSVRETRVAMVADVGVLQRLPQIVGEGPARELIFSGCDIDAARALAIGLVNSVHPDAQAALSAAQDVARQICRHSPLAVQGAKQVLGFAKRYDVQRNLDYVALWNAAFLHSEDLTEALTAFRERRDPSYGGR